jgi:nitrite reductase (cytochrome c-552)
MTDQPPAPATPSHPSPPAWRGWALFAAAVVATFLLGIMAASILQRRQEAVQQQPLPVVIGPWEMDSAKWGEDFPREYESYKLMADSSHETKYGGAAQRDYLAAAPANVILFAGYGFSQEYQQARGHVHSVEDVSKTQRVNDTTPATCWTCKSPDVPRLMHERGIAEFYAGKFVALKGQVTHPIGCFDCHEPNTMRLRITRPALREAFQRQGKDVDAASHQEMRSLVCAQCHVEYYFKGKGNYLTFPWDKGTTKGTTPEQMDEYFTEANFSDFTNKISNTPMVKMRHPDYELYSTGVHAYRNVACADCHMPYRSEGGAKFTDHHLQSPLLNIANSCAVCHRWSEEDIRRRVEGIQDKVHEGRQRAELTLAQAHFDIAAAIQSGADDKELTGVRRLVRSGQLRWDYVAANNGMGFHSPQECLRILAAAVDLAGQCRVECARILARHGVTWPVNYPDFSTKKKAQDLIRQFRNGKPPKLVER